jgi:hypothetical protein
MTAPNRSHFEFLQSIDTPTVCNLIKPPMLIADLIGECVLL